MTASRIPTLLLLAIVAAAGSYLVFSSVGKPTNQSSAAAPAGDHPGMVWIAGGEFLMGNDLPDARPDEHPAHRVRVPGFWIDQTEVTNAQFQKFVEATGYVTTAEQAPDLAEIMSQVPPGTPEPPPESLVPGSLVFTPTEKPVPLDDVGQWWNWTAGADWRHPEGPESTIEGRENHPVVQVSWDDAQAYATWAGKRLPTEAEWEFAARGGLKGKPFVWGDEPVSESKPQANIWQGVFPSKNLVRDGYERTAPVKSFPPNGFGLYDMAGNVWEWCSDWYAVDTYPNRAEKGIADDPPGPPKSFDPRQPRMPQRVQRGGSFLCNASYCSSYRPSARMGCSPDTGMSHVGFRCVVVEQR
jgi:formylglycine-generating enzyme